MYRIRTERRRIDTDYLTKIDQQCFDKPWSLERWEQAVLSDTVFVATYWGTPVAYLVYHGDQIVRFAVKPKHRRKQLGSRLILHLKAEGLREIVTVVPEGLVYGDQCAVAKFLRSNKFIAMAPLIDGCHIKFIWKNHARIARTESNCTGR